MSKVLVKEFENLFEKNQIPFMEILEGNSKNIDLIIKVYFPKIISNICKFLNDTYGLKDKEKIIIKKDEEGFYKVLITLKTKKINIEINSMLQNTWGIANKY